MDSSTPTGSTLVSIVSNFSLIRSKRWRGRELVRHKRVFWAVLAFVYLSLSPFINSPVVGQNVPDTAQTVTINFDSLPTNTIVTNQYAQVNFSASGFSGGQGGPQGFDVWTQSNFGSGGSTPNAIFSTYNPSFTNPGFVQGQGPLYLDFTVPVNDLSFSLLNVRQLTIYVWVYVNRFFYGYYPISVTGNGSLYRVNDFAGIRGITGIQIGPYNYYPFFRNYVPLYYDDFTFTPDFDVRMTNARVNGVLNGTSQNALVGADIALNASVIPSSQTGGAYSWTFTGPYVVVGGAANSSSVTIRSTNTGTLTAKVSYTKNGFTASGTVTINAILPTVTGFTASQSPDLLTRNQNCSLLTALAPGVVFSSGCYQPGGTPDGMKWSATAKIPSGPYLSNPAQSGIKFRQAISMYRKARHRGNTSCFTRRVSPDNITSGWGRDGTDPWGTGAPGDIEFRHFSEGSTLTMSSFDPPAHLLERIIPGTNISYDAFFSDDRFETYVFYFTGSNPANPIFQQAIGFENSPLPIARMEWRWGGQVVFDPSVSFIKYRVDFSNSTQGNVPPTGTDSVKDMSVSGFVPQEAPCLGTTATSNPIDDTRVFVRYHYLDFLGREPDQSGWDYWRGQITGCVFNTTCIENKRIDVSRAFFYSGEFINSVPALAASNRGTDSYNREFVRQCYYRYLQRSCNPEVCDPGGFSFWVNKLNSQYPTMGDGAYNEMIKAFITSPEYRARPFQPLW